MKHISKVNIITLNECTWWIIAKKHGVFTADLKKMLAQIEAMMSYHSKVLLIRFDLRQPTFTENNKRITQFNRRLFKWLKRKYDIIRQGFIWCREQESAGSQHYHYVLMVDGHKVKHSSSILKKAKLIWSEMSGNLWVVKNSFYLLTRLDFKTMQRAIFRVSYLAKATGKNKRPIQTKSIVTSRLKCKKQ